MTLRTRLVLAATLSTVVLVAVLGGVAWRQRSVLTAQLDDQLTGLASNFERFSEGRDGGGFPDPADGFGNNEGDRTPPLGEVYAAVVDGAGSTVFAEPLSQPDLRVSLTAVELAELSEPQEPFTVEVTGADGDARVVAIQVGDDTWVLAAISTEAIDDAQRQLLITGAGAVAILVAALGLVVWWVDRLGIRPIAEVTRAAEDVAAGRADRRVDHPPETTEAGRLGAAFNTMLDERQAAEAKQRRFVADASHELRTPLTTLRGYTALYAGGGLTEPDQIDDAMRRINNEATRMSALVDDLLVLAALDDKRPPEISAVDLSQLLCDIAADGRAIQPGRVIDTEAVHDDLTIAADAHQLTQALTTIVTNALRHTPTDAALSFGAGARHGHVRVEIADAGPGIDPDQVAKLFDRFYRADTGRSRDRGGSGLGLSIAKAIVEAHNGTITVDSTVGVGTSIVIQLPIAH